MIIKLNDIIKLNIQYIKIIIRVYYIHMIDNIYI